MFKHIEKKKKIIAWRVRLMQEMQTLLKAYKVLGNPDLLEFAKEIGRDSEKLKKILEKMK